MDRMTHKETWGYLARVLKSGVLAETGKLACIDTADGSLTKGAASTTLLPIGWFDETKTGDGTLKIRVRLFKEILLYRFKNASSGPIADDDVGSICYMLDDTQATMTAAAHSILGRVWEVTSAGVMVEPAINIGLTGPAGADA
jgi:hypothetical protein